MLRPITVAAIFALVLPTLATAQQPPPPQHGRPAARPGPPPGRPAGPPPGRPPGPQLRAVPHGPVPGPTGGPHLRPMVGPHPGPLVGPSHPGMGGPGGPHPQFGYHGHFFNPVHVSPFIYPPGWEYRSWAVGAVLPPI